MSRALFKVRLAALWAMFTGASRNKKKNSKLKAVGFGLLMLYVAAAFIFMFGTYFYLMADPFNQIGLGWLYFIFYAIGAFALMFIGSLFMAKAQIFEARDNELLLSMPVKPSDILSSRLGALIIINIVFGLLVALPAEFIWIRSAGFSVTSFVAFLLVTIGLVLLSTALSCFFGWLISLLTSRVRNKSLMTVVLSVAFMGAYFYFISQINEYIMDLVSNAEKIAAAIGSNNVIYMIGNSIASGNLLESLLVLVVCLAAFLVAYYVLARTFIKVVTTNHGFAKIKYEEKELKVSTSSQALFGREMKRLLASPMYLMNSGLGAMFAVIGAIILVFAKKSVVMFINEFGLGMDAVAVIAALLICLMAGMIMFTAPSISLEGKTLWQIRSLPVTSKEILDAKIKLHDIIAVPSVMILSLSIVYVLGLSSQYAAFVILVPALFTSFSGNMGLILDLKNPNLNWINETQAVKQSISVLLIMLINFAVIVCGGLVFYFLLMDYALYFFIGYAVVLGVLWRVTYSWVATKGCKRLEEIG